MSWLMLMIVPAAALGFYGKLCQRRADQHRAVTAPAPKPYWDPYDVFRPERYDAEGNRYRSRSLVFTYVMPLFWILMVLVVQKWS